MKKNNTLLIISVLSFTTSCSWMRYDGYRERVRPYLEKIEDTYKPLVVDGVREPEKFPDLDENDDTVEGLDQNKDGVRDDIEIYINRQVFSRYERELLKETYRSYILFYERSRKSSTPKDIAQFHQELWFRYHTCDAAMFSYSGMQQNSVYVDTDFIDIMLNTSKRNNTIGDYIGIAFNETKVSTADTAPMSEYVKYCSRIKDWLKRI